MQSIINFKLFSKIVVLFLVLALIVPSVSYALEGAAGGEADGSQYGGLVDGGTSGSDSSGSTDSTADSTASKEAAEAEKAEAAAAEVAAVVESSGMSGEMSVTPVDTSGSGPPPSGVDVNGVNMSVEDAKAAAGALAEATKNGTLTAAQVGVSTEKTVAGYADGSLSEKKVVGLNTGYEGTPAEVLAQETNYNSSVNSTQKADSAKLDKTTTSLGTDLNDVLYSAKIAADKLNQELGVGTAQAQSSAMVLDVSKNTYVTEDKAAYDKYKATVAPIDQAINQAYDDFANAIDTPNEDAAYDKLTSLSAQKQSLISSTFGTDAKEVQFAGTSQGTPGVAASNGNTQPSNQPVNSGSTGNTPSSVSSQNTGTPSGTKTVTTEFSYAGKVTEANKDTQPRVGTGSGVTMSGNGNGQPSGYTQSAQIIAQVQARDNQITQGTGGVTADKNIFNSNNRLANNFSLNNAADFETDITNVTNVPVVNVKDLSNAQAQVVGIVDTQLSSNDVKSLAVMLAGELYGPATTRIATGNTNADDITAVKSQIFAILNRNAQNGKTVAENVRSASVVFYTPDGSPKGYAEANYNQNPKAFDQMVKDVVAGVYGINVPCPNCVDFGAAGPNIFDPHVTIPSGTYTASGRPQHTSPGTTAAIGANQVKTTQSILTFENRSLGGAPNVDVSNITDPQSFIETDPTKVAANDDDVTTTGSLPDSIDSVPTTRPNNPSRIGGVFEKQSGKNRDAHINKKTKDQLAYAGKVTGTYFVVDSGGNPMSMAEYRAAEGRKTKIGNIYYLNGKAVRVGSTRHDHGNSADGSIVDAATGRTLDFSDPDDQVRIAEFITAAVKAGATGVGAGVEYMGTKTVHIGGGAPLAWGKLGSSAFAPAWLKEAHKTGLNQAKNFNLAKYNAQYGNNIQVAGEPDISTETTGTINLPPEILASLEKVKTAQERIEEHVGHTESDDNVVPEDNQENNPDTDTIDNDSVSNEDTKATALEGISKLSERISEIENQLNNKDLSDEQIVSLNQELDTVTRAIDSFNKAIEAAESRATQDGYDALATALDLLDEVNGLSEKNNAEIANVADRDITPTEVEVPDEEALEVSTPPRLPLPEPVRQVLKNPIARAAITTAILGTNPVVGIAVAVGLDRIKKIPLIGTIIENFIKNFGEGSNSTLNLEDYEDGGNNNNYATSTQAIYTIPVIVTTNLLTGEIDLTAEGIIYDYESIEGSQEGEELYYPSKNSSDLPPIVLNDFGEIIYSDGTYAPVHINGVEYPNPEVKYVYTSQTVGSDGPLPIDENTNILPENFATKFVKNIFGNSGTFSIEDVDQAVRYYVDQNPNVPDDEYYDYVITLKDKTLRTTAIPVYTSFALMEERLSSIGYEGDVIQLLSSVDNGTREDKSSVLTKAYNAVSGLINNFWPEKDTENITDLSTASQSTDAIYDIDDVKEVIVYVGIDADCPDIQGLDKAYIYEAVIYQSSIPNAPADGIIQEVRCGTGDPLAYAHEIALHLERVHGFVNLGAQELLDLTTFNFYNPPPQEINSDQNVEDSDPVEIPAEIELLPNITNAINFEVRATNNVTKETIIDWSFNDLVITDGVSLDFRWDGSDYQQCLPFLNDNGNYALTRDGLTDMTTGNTLTEKYNVAEANYSYVIECGGQRNNEYGVDSKTIKVRFE